MIIKSYAKINLALYVINKRNDGYHNIVSLVVKVDFFDYIEVKPSKRLSLTTNIALLNNNNNLAYKSAEMFFKHTGIKERVSIDIEKHIPFEAGLGGGSSNAAYVLLALNRIYDYPLSFNDLKNIALNIGSDCPFFLYNSASIICSTGEEVYPINSVLPDDHIAIVKPPFGVSTRKAYSSLILTKPTNINRMILEKNLSEGGIFSIMHNDLERSVFGFYPQIKQIKEDMECIFGRSMLCGSGSSVFSISEKSINKQMLAREFDKGFFVQLTSILNNEGRELYEHYRSEN